MEFQTYWYCSVMIEAGGNEYSYISDTGRIPPGSYVAVPFGRENNIKFGIVIKCDKYEEDEVPYPLGKTKRIIRIATEEEFKTGSFNAFEEWRKEIDTYIANENWDDVHAWADRHYRSSYEPVLWEVIHCYRLLLEHDIPEAALNLGAFYYNGRLLKQDYQEAFRLYKIAADAGEPQAFFNCADCFYYGRHQAVDFEQAYHYFSLGALLYNDGGCLYMLGDMFMNGYAVPKNEKYGYALYERAYKEEREHSRQLVFAEIQLRLGRCKLNGIGCIQNLDEALSLLSFSLINFYRKLRNEEYVHSSIQEVKELIAQAEALIEDEEGSDPMMELLPWDEEDE